MPDPWILIATGVGGGFGMLILFYCTVCCCGFRRSGVAANSFASYRHSSIGNVESGSCFAICQSIGAGGLRLCSVAVLFAVGAAIAIGILYGYEWLCEISMVCGGGATGNSTETTTADVLTTLGDFNFTTTTLKPKV